MHSIPGNVQYHAAQPERGQVVPIPLDGVEAITSLDSGCVLRRSHLFHTPGSHFTQWTWMFEIQRGVEWSGLPCLCVPAPATGLLLLRGNMDVSCREARSSAFAKLALLAWPYGFTHMLVRQDDLHLIPGRR